MFKDGQSLHERCVCCLDLRASNVRDLLAQYVLGQKKILSPVRGSYTLKLLGWRSRLEAITSN